MHLPTGNMDIAPTNLRILNIEPEPNSVTMERQALQIFNRVEALNHLNESTPPLLRPVAVIETAYSSVFT